MFRTTSLAALLLIGLLWSGAEAATCPNIPYTFTNGTIADANQVNANFASLLSCSNTSLAPRASPQFTGTLSLGNSAYPAALTSTAQVVALLNSPLAATSLYSGFLGLPAIYDLVQAVTYVPAGSTLFQANGIGSYVQNNAAFSGTDGAAVGLYALNVANVNNARSWTFTGGCIDSSTAAISAGTGRRCIGAEFDLTATSPNTIIQGISLLGSSPSQPSGANGVTCGDLSIQSPGLALWSNCLISQDGAATVALVVGTQTIGSSTNNPSQPIVFDYRDPAGAGQTASVRVDASQRLALTSSAGAGLASFLVDGGVTAALPTSAGGGGLTVCVDTAGIFYKKAACP